MSVLNKTKTYLVGHMQYLNGRDWRSEVSSKLKPLNITCFDPYNKPFVKDVDESENSRLEMQKLLDLENYDEITNRMKTIRSYDLNLVDRNLFKPVNKLGNKIFIYNGIKKGNEEVYGKKIYESIEK